MEALGARGAEEGKESTKLEGSQEQNQGFTPATIWGSGHEIEDSWRLEASDAIFAAGGRDLEEMSLSQSHLAIWWVITAPCISGDHWSITVSPVHDIHDPGSGASPDSL